MYDTPILGILIFGIIVGAAIGIAGWKGCSYVVDHASIRWDAKP